MQGYNMRYGPSAIMELPLAVNPTGSARSEPLLRTHFRSARYVSVDVIKLLHIKALPKEPLLKVTDIVFPTEHVP